ncbi:Gly-X carboxypeptidase [Coprinopsis sp. MPI-PUGE-AT-0042]|nr:Gly-X carboxypeptidase [Coprinopsis sp. MPI-PUGE-AT-0042]
MSSKSEKELDREQLLPTGSGIHSGNTRHKRCSTRLRVIGAFLAVATTLALAYNFDCPGMKNLKPSSGIESGKQEGCPQVDVLEPSKYGDVWATLSKDIGKSNEFRQQAVDWLAGAVRVKTETFDGMGPVEEDPRWDAFIPFHDYLLGAFPLVHTTLKLTKVNTYGLLYQWKGLNPNLKPLMLAAHQDVVPVDQSTLDQWIHPPYDGYFDGKNIWGRGSSDDKSGLIGILATVETLVKNGFRPTRTVVLAFGFDEEASGFKGAGYLAPAIEAIYGKNGIALIVDEGAGFSYGYGSWIATPGIAEKGYFNVQVTVQTSGGHSSVPPPHTSIGILSALLVHAEKNPVKAELTRDQPFYGTLQCIGAHAEDVPHDLRKAIQDSPSSSKALSKLSSIILEDNVMKSLVGTTRAVDLIQGGVKSNALPERAWAVINHRVSVLSSLSAVEETDIDLFKGLAKDFNLTFDAFGQEIIGGKGLGKLTLGDYARSFLPPAPITPTTGEEAEAYRVLSGSIKAAFAIYSKNAGVKEDRGEDIIVAPGMMTGNTDTRFYWDLSKHIFRYSHHNGGKGGTALSSGVHTVNEHIEVSTFLEMIQFFTTLILNADEAELLV